jgi:GxxExxY protein
MEINKITERIIGAAMAVHMHLGPGLLESTYRACLIFEFTRREILFECEKTLPVIYDGNRLDCDYRLDFLVHQKVVVELKAIERLNRVHTAQLLTHLKLSGYTVGLLINFNVPFFLDGLHRVAHDHTDDFPRVPRFRGKSF